MIAAGFSYNIVTAHNACLQLEVTVHGKAGHGAMPETGHDALQAATRVLNAIYGRGAAPEDHQVGHCRHRLIRPCWSGRIDGGTNTNVVPGKVVLKMDRRMIPEEDPVEVEAQVRALIEDAVAGLPGIRVEIRRLLLAHALRPLPGPEKLVDSLRRNARDGDGRSHHRRRARRCTPTRACTANTVSRRCCTAPARARCRSPMRRRPTSSWCWTTCARRPRWWR